MLPASSASTILSALRLNATGFFTRRARPNQLLTAAKANRLRVIASSADSYRFLVLRRCAVDHVVDEVRGGGWKPGRWRRGGRAAAAQPGERRFVVRRPPRPCARIDASDRDAISGCLPRNAPRHRLHQQNYRYLPASPSSLGPTRRSRGADDRRLRRLRWHWRSRA